MTSSIQKGTEHGSSDYYEGTELDQESPTIRKPMKACSKVPVGKWPRQPTRKKRVVSCVNDDDDDGDDDDDDDDNDDDDFVNPGAKEKPQIVPSEANRKDNADQVVKGPHYATIRCSPGSIVEVLKGMPEKVRKKIEECGFGDLLKFNIDALEDRALALYLMSCVRFDPLRLQFKGRSLPLNREALHRVLGVPLSEKNLPVYTYNQKREALIELRRECEKRNMEEIANRGSEGNIAAKKRGGFERKKFSALKATEVPRWVMQEFASVKSVDESENDVDADWTAQSFFMLLFNALLFHTSVASISGLDYLMCKNLDEMKSIDSCGAVLENIKDKARKFQEDVQKKNKGTPSIQGCSVFLVLYYLDNLDCPSKIDDGVTTLRASIFSSKLIENIIKHDKKYDKKDSTIVSFGHCPFKEPAGTCYDVLCMEEQQAGCDAEESSDDVVEICARGGLLGEPQRGAKKLRKTPAARDSQPRPSKAGASKPVAAKAGGSKPGPSKSEAESLPLEIRRLEPLLAPLLDDRGHNKEINEILGEYDCSMAHVGRLILKAHNKVVDDIKELLSEPPSRAEKRKGHPPRADKGKGHPPRAEKGKGQDEDLDLSPRGERAKQRASGPNGEGSGHGKRRKVNDTARSGSNMKSAHTSKASYAGHEDDTTRHDEHVPRQTSPQPQISQINAVKTGQTAPRTDEHQLFPQPQTPQINSGTTGLTSPRTDEHQTPPQPSPTHDECQASPSKLNSPTPDASNVNMTQLGNLGTQKSTSSIAAGAFDPVAWNIMSDILRNIDNDLTQGVLGEDTEQNENTEKVGDVCTQKSVISSQTDSIGGVREDAFDLEEWHDKCENLHNMENNPTQRIPCDDPEKNESAVKKGAEITRRPPKWKNVPVNVETNKESGKSSPAKCLAYS